MEWSFGLEKVSKIKKINLQKWVMAGVSRYQLFVWPLYLLHTPHNPSWSAASILVLWLLRTVQTIKNQWVQKLAIVSKPRLLNLILLNLIVRWPTGATIVWPPNTKYTQSMGACWEKLPKNSENNITAIWLWIWSWKFFHSMIFTVFSKYLSTERNSYRRKLS